jgi:quercetin dioxygenase-like cupin family protein
MKITGIVAVVSMVVVGVALAATASAQAPQPPAVEKGVKTTPLVTSLGAFRQTTNIPIIITGQVVEIEPGGQTGRQRHAVPTYIYILEGTITTNTEGGPIGVAGVQYHTAGQSYSDPVGVWHNYMNNGPTPAKFLQVLVTTPGAPATEKGKADD